MKKENIKVSIVVPVYNVEKYIEKCINSILKQKYKDLEIIIVNDGSTDNSENIILRKVKKDNRIKYIKKENGGLSSARNTGIKEATGEYICFVDSDDWIAENYIECLLSRIEQDKSDMVICNIRHVFDDGAIKKNTAHIEENAVINNREGIIQLFLGKKYRCHAVNKFCKTSLYKDNNIFFPEGKIYEDVFTTYKLILKSKKISLCKEYLYFYLRNRSGSILSTSFNKKRLDIFDALNSIATDEEIKKLNLKQELQFFYIQEIISLFVYIYPIYNKKEFNNYFKEIKKKKNKKITNKCYANKYLTLTSKIKILMINICPNIYCKIRKKIKK